MLQKKTYFIGTAGWTIPTLQQSHFNSDLSHLERYSQKFNCVEINSSFYRHHKWQTYDKWAQMVPDDFRFSVKLSKELTHEAKLELSLSALEKILDGPIALKEKWGVLLIQLAPKHEYAHKTVYGFFSKIRTLFYGPIAIEPRHQSWNNSDATQIFFDFGISIVRADPIRIRRLNQRQSQAGGFGYLRLHGSPIIYKSAYEQAVLENFASQMGRMSCDEVWCIFDNTAYGHAISNAFSISHILN